MRELVSFAIAAPIMMVFGTAHLLFVGAIGFWTITSVVETTASVRSKVPAPTTRVIQVQPIALAEVLVEG
jgi:hypothetical protein